MQSDVPAEGWWHMGHKRRFLRILRFPLGLVLMIGAFVPQAFAPNPEPQLVAYLVTWHATGRGLGHTTHPNDEVTDRHFAETTGSAIVRFTRDRDGRLLPRDTRLLSVKVADRWQHWEVLHFPEIGCNVYRSNDIVDPSENSALYVPLGVGDPAHPNPPQLFPNPSEKRADGLIVITRPFSTLSSLWFTRREITILTPGPGFTAPEGCGPGAPEHTYAAAGSPNEMYPHTLEQEQKFVLQSVIPKDDSYFSMNVRFSTQEGPSGSHSGTDFTEQVEWAAQARRLGTCPCALNSVNPLASGLAWASSPNSAPAFINYDDQGLKDGKAKEVVDVWPIDHEMDPNGSMPVQGGAAKIKGMGVQVRVTTCEGVPVKGETVQITIDPKRYSGGHDHHLIPVSRPGGKLNDKEINKAYPDSGTFTCPCIEVTTDKDGYAYAAPYPDVPTKTIRFQPPHAAISGARYGRYEVGVAGEYIITARSKQFPDSKASDSITAAVEGLTPMPADQNTYLLERGGIDTHPLGFHATAGTIEKFKELAAAFRQTQNNWNNQLKICNQKWHFHLASINDIALPTGGIFDWHQSWKPSHQTHNRGQGGDFNRFGDIKDDEPAFGCVPTPPLGGQTVIIAPLRSLLLHTLLELGKNYGHWDCSDLGADVPVGPEVPISSKQCQNGEFPDALFPFQANTTLHLHVED